MQIMHTSMHGLPVIYEPQKVVYHPPTPPLLSNARTEGVWRKAGGEWEGRGGVQISGYGKWTHSSVEVVGASEKSQKPKVVYTQTIAISEESKTQKVACFSTTCNLTRSLVEIESTSPSRLAKGSKVYYTQCPARLKESSRDTHTHIHTLTHTYTQANTYTHMQIHTHTCLLYTSPSPRDRTTSRMPSSA